jgi:hypothetical protein
MRKPARLQEDGCLEQRKWQQQQDDKVSAAVAAKVKATFEVAARIL